MPFFRHLPARAALGLLAGASACTAAFADSLDTLQLSLATQLMADNNVFRLPDDVSASQAGLAHAKSDRSESLQLGLKLDKSWSLQRVVLDASVSHVHYDDYGFLDYNATNYDGSWMWQVTPRLTGTLAASQSQTLVNYGDYRQFGTRQVVTNANRNLGFDWDASAGWHAIGGLVQSEYRTSTAFAQQTAYRTDALQLGGKYVARSGNWVQLVARDGRGTNPDQALDYAQLLDNSYAERAVELSTLWTMSGKSSLSATLGGRNHQDTHFGQRNFSGLAGNATWTWTPTGKLQLKLIASRDLYAYIESVFPYYFTTSYAVVDAIALAPVWQVDAHTQLQARAGWSQRSLEGELGPLFRRRVDTPLDLMLEGDWSPLRTLTVSLNLQYERRDSTIPDFGYSDTLLSLSGQWAF